MELRRAAAADVDRITTLRLEFLADHRGIGVADLPAGFAEENRAWIDRVQATGRLATWLAEVDGVAAGVTSVLLRDIGPRPGDPRTLDGHLLHVWVRPRHRRAGIGRALVAAALGAGPELGIRSFTLHTTDDGRPLYEDLGFVASTVWMERPSRPPT